MYLVAFTFLDLTDTFLDGFFYGSVENNSDNLLDGDEVRYIKALIAVCLTVGCMMNIINIVLAIVKCRKDSESDQSGGSLANRTNEEITQCTPPMHIVGLLMLLKDFFQLILCLYVAFTVDTFINTGVQLTKAVLAISKVVMYMVYFRHSDMSIWKNKENRIMDCFNRAFFVGNVLNIICGVILLFRLAMF